MHNDKTTEIEGKGKGCFEGMADNVQRESRVLRMEVDAVFVRRNPAFGIDCSMTEPAAHSPFPLR